MDDYLAAPDDLAAAAAVRLLPGDRRRLRGRSSPAPSGPRDLRQAAGADPRRRRRAALADPQPGIQFPVVLRDDITTLPAKPTADTLYRRAGLGPADIDVAQLYDCFTITVLLQLEDYGFCAKGEGGAFVSSGAIELGGSLPINTGGGHLSEGYIHGMNHIVEGVRQIRGESTVAGAGRRGRASSRPRRCRPAAP